MSAMTNLSRIKRADAGVKYVLLPASGTQNTGIWRRPIVNSADADPSKAGRNQSELHVLAVGVSQPTQAPLNNLFYCSSERSNGCGSFAFGSFRALQSAPRRRVPSLASRRGKAGSADRLVRYMAGLSSGLD